MSFRVRGGAGTVADRGARDAETSRAIGRRSTQILVRCRKGDRGRHGPPDWFGRTRAGCCTPGARRRHKREANTGLTYGTDGLSFETSEEQWKSATPRGIDCGAEKEGIPRPNRAIPFGDGRNRGSVILTRSRGDAEPDAEKMRESQKLRERRQRRRRGSVKEPDAPPQPWVCGGRIRTCSSRSWRRVRACGGAPGRRGARTLLRAG